MTLSRRFIPSEFRPSMLTGQNPSRGWYQVFPFDAAKPVDEAAAASSLGENDRLALALLDISAYQASSLDDKALKNIEDILGFFKKHRIETIVRPVYDRQGKGMENEPLSFSLVKEHIRQMGTVFAEYSQNIHAVQGVIVGNWGEMHGSKFLSDKHLTELGETLHTALKGSCYINVRTPMQQRMLGGRAGLFNDGLFGSKNHLGTFVNEDDSQYAELCCKGVPNGGETVFGGDFTPQQTVDVLNKMNITYLNRIYDSRVLDMWKETPFTGARSLYDFIGSRLGYRFELTDVNVRLGRLAVKVKLKITNSGFGCLTKPSSLRFYAEEEGRAPVIREFPAVMPDSGETKSFICVFSGWFRRAELFAELLHENGERIRPVNCPDGQRIHLGSITDCF